MIGTEFSTHLLHPRDKAAIWGHTINQHFGRLELQELPGQSSDSRMLLHQLDDLRVFRICGPAHRVQQLRRLDDHPVTDSYKLVLQLQGCGRIEQEGAQVDLRPGEWTIYDPRLPYAITNPLPTELLVLQVPRSSVLQVRLRSLHPPDPEDAALSSLHALVSNYLRNLADQLPRLPNPAAEGLSKAALSLLSTTLTASAQRHEPVMLPELMRLRVKQLVLQRLSDPELSLDDIADALHCSKRYLHKVFQDEGVTLERFIWDSRLARCHDALRSARAACRSISQVAFAWGFNSSSHFTRLFKARYGMTPSDFCAELTESA